MTDVPKRVKFAVGEIRKYARYLRDWAEEIDEVRRKVDGAKLSTNTWGSVYLGFLPGADVDDTWKTDSGHSVIDHASIRPDAAGIARVKSAYENAHDAALVRLKELQQAYRQAAKDLESVADRYEVNEESARRAIREAAGE